jgi:hypothetical protein
VAALVARRISPRRHRLALDPPFSFRNRGCLTGRIVVVVFIMTDDINDTFAAACAQADEKRAAEDLGARASLPELEAALDVLPNTGTWNEWNRVGMAAWVASKGQGFGAFDTWSRKSPKYDERNTKLRWNGFYQSPPSRIGAGTIFHLAAQTDPNWRSKVKIPEAPAWQKKAVEEANKGLADAERKAIEKKRIDELARKDRMEYDRARKPAAAELRVAPRRSTGKSKSAARNSRSKSSRRCTPGGSSSPGRSPLRPPH